EGYGCAFIAVTLTAAIGEVVVGQETSMPNEANMPDNNKNCDDFIVLFLFCLHSH
ncbi:hypothetical protein HMPREF3034_02467, partial [Prevotella sp. DNF00663]